MRVSWSSLLADVRSCEKCALCRGRMNVVPGEGDPNADLMFIGEGRARRKTGWAAPSWAARASF